MMKKNDEMHVFIKAMLSRSRKLVILLILIIAGSVITSLIPPLVLEKAVNRLSNHQSVSFLHALSYFLFIVLADVLESLQNACITIFGQKMTHSIRSALCNKLSRLPAQYCHYLGKPLPAVLFQLCDLVQDIGRYAVPVVLVLKALSPLFKGFLFVGREIGLQIPKL